MERERATEGSYLSLERVAEYPSPQCWVVSEEDNAISILCLLLQIWINHVAHSISMSGIGWGLVHSSIFAAARQSKRVFWSGLTHLKETLDRNTFLLAVIVMCNSWEIRNQDVHCLSTRLPTDVVQWPDTGGCTIWLVKCDLGERLSSTHKHSFSIVSFPCFVWSNHWGLFLFYTLFPNICFVRWSGNVLPRQMSNVIPCLEGVSLPPEFACDYK